MLLGALILAVAAMLGCFTLMLVACGFTIAQFFVGTPESAIAWALTGLGFYAGLLGTASLVGKCIDSLRARRH